MILRDYQLEAVDALWKALFTQNHALCVLPCGAGKTEVIFELIRRSKKVKPDIKILFALRRINLLEQTYRRAKEFNPSIYSGSLGEKDLSSHVVIGSVQSLVKADLPQFNIFIIDEAHNINLNDKNSAYYLLIQKLIQINERTKFIGFTATPYRNNGFIYGKDEFFERIHYQKEIGYFIDHGYLCPPTLMGSKKELSFDVSKLKTVAGEYSQSGIDIQASDVEKTKKQVIDALSRLENRKKVIWFCANIEHAKRVYDILCVLGENAAIIHSKQSDDEQKYNTRFFENESARHLVFITIVAEGWDFVPTDALVILRPTRSANLYVQVVGRILRPYVDKKNALILDYGQVIENLGPISDPILEFENKNSDKEKSQYKFCEKCLGLNARENFECIECGHLFEKLERTSVEKKLTDTPHANADLLSVSPKQQEVVCSGAAYFDYKSKAGNHCVLIKYFINSGFNFHLPSYIGEYYTIQYKLNQGRSELQKIGLDYDTVVHGEKAKIWPKKLIIAKNGKYWEIVKKIWD